MGGGKRPPPRRRISKASLVWLVVTAAFAVLAVASVLVSPREPARRAGLLPGFDLQGHRGARGLFPENSLPAFEAALRIGVHTLEMDVAMTRDGVLVVHHGRRLDPERTRTAAGDWLPEDQPGPVVRDLEYAQVDAYDVGRLRPGGRGAERFPDQQGLDGLSPPALAAALARAERLSGSAVRYNVEPKLSPLAADEAPSPEVFAEALLAAFEAAGVTDRAMVQSFDWRVLRHVQALDPTIPTAYLTAEQSWLDNLQRGAPGASPWTAGLDVDDHEASVPRTVAAAGGAVWSPYYRDLREADLREAHRLGLRVVVWTVNDPGDMASLIDLGVDGIITDYPDRLRDVMAAKGLALPPAFPAGAPRGP